MEQKVQFIINNKLEVMWNDGNYKSNIQNVTDKYISISIPTKDGQYIPLKKDDRIMAIYYNGANVYQFSSVVIDRAVDGIPIINVEIPSKLQKVQRRNHFRIPLIVDVACAIVGKDKSITEIGNNQIDFFNAFTLDVSGGGLKLVTKQKVHRGDKLLITITLKDQSFSMNGEIARVEKNKDNTYLCGVNFVNNETKTTEKLVKIIFGIMREQVQRTSEEE